MGYDNAWLVTREGPSSPYTYDWTQSGPIATLASNWSGITLDIYSDQEVSRGVLLLMDVLANVVFARLSKCTAVMA